MVSEMTDSPDSSTSQRTSGVEDADLEAASPTHSNDPKQELGTNKDVNSDASYSIFSRREKWFLVFLGSLSALLRYAERHTRIMTSGIMTYCDSPQPFDSEYIPSRTPHHFPRIQQISRIDKSHCYDLYDLSRHLYESFVSELSGADLNMA